MLELDVNGRMPADLHADRMAIALRVFAEGARDTVREVVGEAGQRLQQLDGATQLRTLIRMADDRFWTSVDQPLAGRFEAVLKAEITGGSGDPLPPDIAAGLAVVGSVYARQRLPGVANHFDCLGDYHRQTELARGSR